MRLYNPLIQCNSYTKKKVLQADMRQASKPTPPTFFHPWMALTLSYMFKQKLLTCEPIDLSRFVVDLRKIHLELDTLF